MNMTLDTKIPYRGLVPFEETDAPYFFGRQADVRLIIDNLFASRVTLLFGESGVGKTSILRAGVIPTLRDIAKQNVAFFGKPELVIAVCTQWQYDPLAAALAALDTGLKAVCVTPEISTEPLPQNLVGALEFVSKAVQGDVYFVLDQFEEYLVYHGDNPSDPFAIQLEQAVRNPSVRAHFLFSIREDRLARLDHFKGRIPGLFDNLLRVRHLAVEEAKQAIVGPIERLNTETEGGGFAVEPGLVEAIVATGSGRAQPRRKWFLPGGTENAAEVEGPFIQLVMEKVWQAEQAQQSRVLRLATLQSLGGPEQIAQNHVDAAMTSLSNRQRSLALDVLRYLVTPSGGKFAMSIDDLAIFSERPAARIALLLERLAKADLRILRPVDPPEGTTTGIKYEVSHDILAMALQEWFVRYRARRLQRRLRTLGSLSIFAAIVAVSMWWWASLTRDEVTRTQEKVTQLETQAVEKEKTLELVVAESEETRTRLELATQSAVATRVDQIRDEGPYGPLVAGVAAMEALVQKADFAVELKLRDILSSLLERTHTRLLGANIRATHVTHGGAVTVVVSDDGGLVAYGRGGGRKLWQRTLPKDTQVVFAPGEATWVEWNARGARLCGTSQGIVGPLGPLYSPPADPKVTDPFRIVGVGRLGFVLQTADGTLRVIDGYSGTSVGELPKVPPIGAILSVDSTGLVACAATENDVRIVSRTGQFRVSLPDSAGNVQAVSFTDGGQLVVVAGEDGGARVYEYANADPNTRMKHRLRSPFVVQRFVPGPTPWFAAIVEPREITGAEGTYNLHRQVAIGTQRNYQGLSGLNRVSSESVVSEGLVLFWNLETATEELRMAVSTSVAKVAFAPDAQTAALVGTDRVIRLFTLPTGIELGRAYASSAELDVGVFSEERSLFRRGSPQQRKEQVFSVVIADKTAGRLDSWAQIQPDLDLNVQLASGTPLKIVTDGAGDRIVVAAGEGGLQWLNGSTLEVTQTKMFPDPVTDVVATPLKPAVVIATGQQLRYAPQGDFGKGESEKPLQQQSFGGKADSLTMRQGTEQIAWVNEQREAYIWDIAGNKTTPLGRGITAVAFSTDGAHLAAARLAGQVDILDTTLLTTVRTLRPGGVTRALRWAPDEALCGGVGDYGLRIWSVNERRGGPKTDEIGPGARDLVFGGDRWNVLVHEGASAQMVRDGIPLVHGKLSDPSRIVALSYHPKTKGFLVGLADGEVRTWLGRTEILLQQACTRLPTHWTADQWKTVLPEGTSPPDLSRCQQQVAVPVE